MGVSGGRWREKERGEGGREEGGVQDDVQRVAKSFSLGPSVLRKEKSKGVMGCTTLARRTRSPTLLTTTAGQADQFDGHSDPLHGHCIV